jgi:uncharacterized membrane protein YqaE (UPF0057 family)
MNNTDILINIQYPDNSKKYKKVSREVFINSNYDKLLNELQIFELKKNNKILINGILINGNKTYLNKINKNIITKKNNTNSKYNSLYIEIIPKLNGGFIMELFSAVINIFKLLAGIPRFFMYVGRLIVWLLQFLYFILVVAAGVFDKDGIFGLCKYIVGEIMFAPIKFIFHIIKNFVNNIGYMTIAGVMGADNVKRQDEEEPTEFHTETAYEEKCYRTGDGLVPFSVIIATILCPPIGVYMEYGLFGWINILICALLTLAFYFPGLIYALILLYC